MKVFVFKEEGYPLALRGLAYSFKDPAEPIEDWWTPAKVNKMMKVGRSLSQRGAEERKWIRQISVWLDIVMPRYWWSEFDTYKVGVTTQSESTMHKLAKRPPLHTDFAECTPNHVIESFKTSWDVYRSDIQRLKSCLPEGFLQRRMVMTNYESLRTMYWQRRDHRLPEWTFFCDEIIAQLEHPELIDSEWT